MERKAFTPSVFFHPGVTLDEKLKEMKMDIKEFSRMTSVPERVVWDVTNGDASISADMALAFEKVTQIPARLWIKSQHLYDEYILTQRPTTYLDRLERWEHEASRWVVAEED
jgi:addiction module HigA family antidote